MHWTVLAIAAWLLVVPALALGLIGAALRQYRREQTVGDEPAPEQERHAQASTRAAEPS